MSESSGLSKHVQTIVVSLATAALTWVAYSIQELKVEVAVLSEKVDQLETRTYAQVAPANVPSDPFDGPLFKYDVLPVSIPEPRRK